MPRIRHAQNIRRERPLTMPDVLEQNSNIQYGDKRRTRMDTPMIILRGYREGAMLHREDES